MRCRFSSSSLPKEIIEEVIARVPCIKSVLRCTLVCKSWQALIKSTNFIKLHLSLTACGNSNKHLLCEYNPFGMIPRSAVYAEGNKYLIHYTYFARLEPFQRPYFAIHDDSETFQEYCKFLFPRHDLLLQLEACNGLICYNTSDDPDCLYLWNPTIGREKRIPTPLPNLNNGHQDAVFKLWFDNKVNDYKILRITYTSTTCTVEVYSLTANSWRLITDDAPVTSSCLNSNRLAYLNGTFYWPVRRDGNWILISLDIENETFKERSTIWISSALYLIPSDHDDSLIVMGYGHEDEETYTTNRDLSLFEVRDYSLNISYTIVNDIVSDPRFFLHRPIGFRNNGELLLRNEHSDFEIDSFNIKAKSYKKFAPTRSGRRLRRVIPFGETIALINDADATIRMKYDELHEIMIRNHQRGAGCMRLL